MHKNLSAKYYQENKAIPLKKQVKISKYFKISKKSNNMVMNVRQIS